MKKNQLRLFGLAGLCFGLACTSAQANIILLEQVVGYDTGNFGSSSTTGTANNWGNSTANITLTNGSGSLDGTGLGLLTSQGDKVFIGATASLSARNQFAASGAFPQANDTNLFYSFLYRFNVGTDVSATGQTIMRLNRANSGTTTAQHWDLEAKNTGGSIQIGIAKAGGNITNYAATNLSVGQTFFVVVRQHIIPGAQNDVYDLWINPPANTFGVTDTNSIPPSDAEVGTVTTDGTEDSSTTGPGRLVLASGANANFDEFRITTTWAEATPPLGQCIAAGISQDPTNITQVAEIAATFTSSASGTSPTFQWQVAPKNSSTFANIPGATTFTYTTPNLSLATDNGNQYRVIATTVCDGLSATSKVATITLTAPVVTPPGLVMFDDFSDQLRDNTPVTTNNSVWRTATSADLNAVPGTGLQAIPVTASASLWMGYFVSGDFNDPLVTNPPVDLAIGTGIRVTLPIQPNSNGSFGGTNSGLRFGLFDYADGGTLISGDGTTAGGSTGNGIGVRGYMLNLDYGTKFSTTTPLQWLGRNNLNDINLMGTTSDYTSFGSGPSGSTVTTNTVAFVPPNQYQLVMTATRTAVNTMVLTAAVTGGVTNLTWSVTDTNLAYHRFDAFGIRDNSLETTADMFTFADFEVEVFTSSLPPPAPIPITTTESGNNIVLTWANPAFNLQASTSVNGTYTNIVGAASPFTNALSGTSKFFRLTTGN